MLANVAVVVPVLETTGAVAGLNVTGAGVISARLPEYRTITAEESDWAAVMLAGYETVKVNVLLSGIDDTFAQTVHTRSSYRSDDLVWNARFLSIFERDDDGARLRANIGKLHDYEPA